MLSPIGADPPENGPVRPIFTGCGSAKAAAQQQSAPTNALSAQSIFRYPVVISYLLRNNRMKAALATKNRKRNRSCYVRFIGLRGGFCSSFRDAATPARGATLRVRSTAPARPPISVGGVF